jgi:hypothetical protein
VTATAYQVLFRRSASQCLGLDWLEAAHLYSQNLVLEERRRMRVAPLHVSRRVRRTSAKKGRWLSCQPAATYKPCGCA